MSVRGIAAESLSIGHHRVSLIPDINAVCIEQQITRRISDRCTTLAGIHLSVREDRWRGSHKIQSRLIPKIPFFVFVLGLNNKKAQAQKYGDQILYVLR